MSVAEAELLPGCESDKAAAGVEAATALVPVVVVDRRKRRVGVEHKKRTNVLTGVVQDLVILAAEIEALIGEIKTRGASNDGVVVQTDVRSTARNVAICRNMRGRRVRNQVVVNERSIIGIAALGFEVYEGINVQTRVSVKVVVEDLQSGDRTATAGRPNVNIVMMKVVCRIVPVDHIVKSVSGDRNAGQNSASIAVARCDSMVGVINRIVANKHIRRGIRAGINIKDRPSGVVNGVAGHRIVFATIKINSEGISTVRV